MPPPIVPQQQPALVKSITDDDDSNSQYEDPLTRYANDNDVDGKALAYLLRYETMVRQQEAEDMATLAHVRPLLERIERLGGNNSSAPLPFMGEASSPQGQIMENQVSYRVLERALDALEASSEVMTTDKQLMMVLKTLTAKPPTSLDESISWAEFLQCYKTVVAGMQTLQHLPASSEARSRARDRTLSILSLFEPSKPHVPKTIETEGPFVTPERPDAGRHVNYKRGPSPENSWRTFVIKVFFLIAVAAALTLGAFYATPEVAQKDASSSKRPSPKVTTTSPSRSSTSTKSNKQQTVRPIDTFYHRSAMEPSRPPRQYIARFPVPPLQSSSSLAQQPSPASSVRKVMWQSMILSALSGGVVGAALAPQAWSTIQILVPKVVALVGTQHVVVTTGAIVVTSLAVSALLQRSVGFLWRVLRNKQKQ